MYCVGQWRFFSTVEFIFDYVCEVTRNTSVIFSINTH